MIGSRPLSNDEIRKCLDSFDGRFTKRNQALFILGLNSGFRISELLSLKIKDVQTYTKINDQLTVSRANMKNKISGRTVFLNDLTKKYLKDFLDNWSEIYGIPYQKDFYLFKSQKTANKAISSRQATQVLYDVFELNELTGKLGTHCMRKSFAKNIHQALGEDITKTQKALGHKQLSSTTHYLSFDQSEIDDAISHLNIGSSNINENTEVQNIQIETSN